MTALREFVGDLLEIEGAMVEPIEPDGLDVMAPEGLRATYGWPELARLGFGAAAPSGSIPIGLEDDWLDRLGLLLGSRGRICERQMPMPDAVSAPNDPQRLIDSALTLPNAVWRLTATVPSWSRCLLLAFRYCAVSDEKRDGLVWLGFNCTTGAVLDEALIAALQRSLLGEDDWLAATEEARLDAGPPWTIQALSDRAAPLLDRRVRADLEPFLGDRLRQGR